MSDSPEQIVADRLDPSRWTLDQRLQTGAMIVAALRGAGWSLVRLDDYETGVFDGATFADNPAGKIGLIVLVPERAVVPDYGSYRLVPVSGKSPTTKGDEGE